jgi:hypothetical protein
VGSSTCRRPRSSSSDEERGSKEPFGDEAKEKRVVGHEDFIGGKLGLRV